MAALSLKQILLLLMCQSCVLYALHAPLVVINFDEFSEQYSLYVRYTAHPQSRAGITMYDYNWDIALHVDVRYLDDFGCTGSNLVVTSRIGGVWWEATVPEDFPFSTIETITSLVVVPKASEYAIFFDFGSLTKSYTFPYRDNQRPSWLRHVHANDFTGCSTSGGPTIHEFAVGYAVSSLNAGSSIHINATAPSVGTVIIDVNHGKPQERDDSRIPLRMLAHFGSVQTLQLQTVEIDQTITATQSVSNPMLPETPFIINITMLQSGYMITVNNEFLSSSSTTDLARSKEATVWVSGVTFVDKIIVLEPPPPVVAVNPSSTTSQFSYSTKQSSTFSSSSSSSSNDAVVAVVATVGDDSTPSSLLTNPAGISIGTVSLVLLQALAIIVGGTIAYLKYRNKKNKKTEQSNPPAGSMHNMD